MATFRKVHTSFWGDPYIQSLSPEQRYFYLYLLTNERTKQCGIYEIGKKQVAYDTGYNVDSVTILLNHFVSADKIRYNEETSEIGIKNWSRYNDQTSPKVKACIHKELIVVKDKSLLEYCGYEIPEGVAFNKNYRVAESLRKLVFERDGFKCQKCKSEDSLSIDHIIPMSLNGKSISQNLRCLCRSCNSSRPLVGEDLVKEVNESGYDFDYLYTLSTGFDAYQYSIRREPQEEKEEEKEEDLLNNNKKGSQFPKAENFNGLDDMKTGQVIEFLKATKGVVLDQEAVGSIWGVFKMKNLTGQKFYKDEHAVYSHFLDSLKYQQFNINKKNTTNATDQHVIGKTFKKD
jgi:hypothetical protein